jgi:tetratricopeptide (TPR) repeat protein
MRLIDKFGNFLKPGRAKEEKAKDKAQEKYLDLVHKEPDNAKAHMKLAETYQKKGEKKKAVEEYLLAADIFAKNNFYARAMAVYKQVPKQDPSLDHVYLKIADIYKKMGFLGDALAQYRLLIQYYDHMGMKEKALAIMGLMAEVDHRKSATAAGGLKSGLQIPKLEGETTGSAESNTEKLLGGGKKDFFDLGAELETDGSAEIGGPKEIFTSDEVSGAGDIFKELKETAGPSVVDPHFNYSMGVACREMGFLDDAIEQFQMAMSLGQNPFESASMLAFCFREKGMLDEARQNLQKALKMPGVSQEKKLNVKYELGLLYKAQGKTEEAFGILKEISEVDQRFRDTAKEIGKLKGKLKNAGNSLTK